MLTIKHKRIQITKVKQWSILFTYDGQSYLIHGSYECGEPSIQTLYKRDVDECGRYKLEFINRVYGDDNVEYDYIRNRKQTIVYSQIDTEKFILKLTANGLCDSYLSPVVEDIKRNVEKVKEEIRTLDKIIQSKRTYINNAFN